MRSRWRTEPPITAGTCPPDDGGDARRRARTAHTARQAERARPEAGRQTAETAATAGRAPRAQPTLANGQRTREVVPLPPLKFPLGGDPPKGVSPTRGRGERPVGAAGEGERPDAKQNGQLCPTPRQALRPSAKQAPGGKPRARRKGAKATRQPVTRTHERARPAAKPTRPTTERRPAGAGVAPPPPHAQQRHDHARGRRNGGETGGDGAGRAALGRGNRPPPMPPAQKNATQGRASRERGRRRARRARRARKSARIARPASAGTRARPPEARRGGAPTAHRFPLQTLGMG